MPKTKTIYSIYDPQHLEIVRDVVKFIQDESGLALEPMAIAINQSLPENEGIGKDTIHRLSKIGLDDGVKGSASLYWLPLLSRVSKTYTEEDLRAIARGSEPLSAKARERHGLLPLNCEVKKKELVNTKSVAKIRYLLNMIRAACFIMEQEMSEVDKGLSPQERQELDALIGGENELSHWARKGLVQDVAGSVIDRMLMFAESESEDDEQYNKEERKLTHLI